MSNKRNFECQESCGGKCCSLSWLNGQSFVFLTKMDMYRISKKLNKLPGDFALTGIFKFTRFTRKESIQWYMKMENGSCMFFKDGKCGIYEVRPTQCRTFPYWPELMNQKKWGEMKSICPGIDKGDDSTLGQKVLEQLKADEELCK